MILSMTCTVIVYLPALPRKKFYSHNTPLIIPGQRTPVEDGSRAKDIIKLREPTHATKDIEILFSNQAVPLKEVVIANIEKDRKMNKVRSSKELPVPTPPQ